MNVLEALIDVTPMQLATTLMEVTPVPATLDTQVMDFLAQVNSPSENPGYGQLQKLETGKKMGMETGQDREQEYAQKVYGWRQVAHKDFVHKQLQVLLKAHGNLVHEQKNMTWAELPSSYTCCLYL